MPKPQSKTTAYAFSQPNTANHSSAVAKAAEREKFYSPLPPPAPNNHSHHQQQSQQQQQQQYRNQPALTINPFADPNPSSPSRQYDSRSPSPQLTPSNPLLPHSNNNNNMPPSASSGRNYGPRALNGGMPVRGESQSALLGDQRVSVGCLVLFWSVNLGCLGDVRAFEVSSLCFGFVKAGIVFSLRLASPPCSKVLHSHISRSHAASDLRIVHPML